jgi:hypothetical protein
MVPDINAALRHGFMRLWPAATNDGFSDPSGMDARRARSDRDVARARGQKNRVSKDLRATKREAGSLPDRREG